MIGSTIIAEKDTSRLAGIVSPDDLDDFVYLDLDVMMTLDFEELVASSGNKWAEGDPIQFDPKGGLATFKISPAGLAYILEQISALDEPRQADLRKLAEFVRANRTSDIYEFATF